jgi:hypothetical protein
MVVWGGVFNKAYLNHFYLSFTTSPCATTLRTVPEFTRREIVSNPKYTWYIKPYGDITSEQISAFFSSQCITPFEVECTIEVGGKSMQVYRVQYSLVTFIKRSEFHRNKFKVYVREGAGKPRIFPFTTGNRRKLPRTKEVERVKAELEKRTSKPS